MGRLTGSSSGGNVSVISGANTLAVNPDGSINANLDLPSASSKFAEITNVPKGIETTIVTYTVITTIAKLVMINCSGENIGEVRVYKNSDMIDKQYLYYMGFNLTFNFNNLIIMNGDIISVKGVNNGEDVCNFNAKIQTIEVS